MTDRASSALTAGGPGTTADRAPGETTDGGVAAETSGAVRLSGRRVPRRLLAVLLVIALVATGTAWFLLRGKDAVVNGSAGVDTRGWQATSDAGKIRVWRFSVDDGPDGAQSAVDLRRGPGSGTWAMALATLRSPERYFVVGRTYRMRVWVRDLDASGKPLGMLLADSNFGSRPTDASRYASFRDRGWHLLTRTFVCRAAAGTGTRLYLALPTSGALHWQVTRASVRQVDPVAPPTTSGEPSQVVSFGGPAGAPPNAAQWNHELGGGGWGNNEQQTYVDSPDTAQLDGAGHLVLTARRQPTVGDDGIRRLYRSARLSTAGKVSVPAGSYVEASIRFPVGSGVWPAFWLVGDNLPKVGWPAAGELDIAEVYGRSPTLVHSNVHLARASDPTADFPYGGGSAGATNLFTSVDSREHRYGVYFDGRLVQFYVDRRPTLTVTAEDAVVSGRSWPFGASQYLVVDVAIGGFGKGNPARTTFPRQMVVGPVSVWRGGTPF